MLEAVERLAGARDLLDRATVILGRDLRADDTADGYRSTVVAQRALFVAGVASARALQHAGVSVDAVAGHSVGTYAAAVIAGAIDFVTALCLVDRRAHLMARAFPAGYGMGAIGGLSERDVAELVAENTSSAAPIFTTNVNAPDQIAVAGALPAIARVIAAARTRGARTARSLDVCVPSHTPLMHDVARALGRECASCTIRAAQVLYATNVGGRLTRDADLIRRDLGCGVSRPVRWADATRALYERGVRLFVEMRPGSNLADLATYAFSDARAVALEIAGIDSVVALAQRFSERQQKL